MSAKTEVLVVDDEAAILRFLKPALEANGYEMTSAGSVAEATKRIAADSPDIVLLDLGLPDGDGKDVLRRARDVGRLVDHRRRISRAPADRALAGVHRRLRAGRCRRRL